ncbi:hypothetical protein Cgig2_019103 [Carnegiea gigantea]|uniref:Peroxidase n=1 Tax=Carnegiea gigantea TaxID=171969 RepID=A0A9Q1KCQ3_9CARY|nr:hypothetical protein Cgig2_019103 [Carnegiea gigantea]
MRAFCVFLVCNLVLGLVRAGDGNYSLTKNFYKKVCPRAERLIRDITWKKTQADPALGAKLIRLQFHDCFLRGCDASVLLDTVGNTTAEKDAGPNRSLLGFDVIDEIKTQVEKLCPNTVSCADILALTARDSVSFQYKKDLWDVYTGRRDGVVSLASEVNSNIPPPSSNFTSLKQLFASKGLNDVDLVVLSGAHTLGVAHCGAFSRRLFNFTGEGDVDPSLDPTYAAALRAKCPNPPNPSTTVEMDPQSSLSFDNHYYNILRQKEGLFVSDAALLTDASSAKLVEHLATKKDHTFFAYFAKSMKKMAAIGVLTGEAGQIRKQCRVVNA